MPSLVKMGRLWGINTHSNSLFTFQVEFNQSSKVELMEQVLQYPIDGSDENIAVVTGDDDPFTLMAAAVLELRLKNLMSPSIQDAFVMFIKLLKVKYTDWVIDDDDFIRAPNDLNPKQLAIQYNQGQYLIDRLTNPSLSMARIPDSDIIIGHKMPYIWLIQFLLTSYKGTNTFKEMEKRIRLFKKSEITLKSDRFISAKLFDELVTWANLN